MQGVEFYIEPDRKRPLAVLVGRGVRRHEETLDSGEVVVVDYYDAIGETWTSDHPGEYGSITAPLEYLSACVTVSEEWFAHKFKVVYALAKQEADHAARAG